MSDEVNDIFIKSEDKAKYDVPAYRHDPSKEGYYFIWYYTFHAPHWNLVEFEMSPMPLEEGKEGYYFRHIGWEGYESWEETKKRYNKDCREWCLYGPISDFIDPPSLFCKGTKGGYVETPLKLVYVQFTPENAEKVCKGTKTTTLRTQKQFEKIGLEVDEMGLCMIKDKYFKIYCEGAFTIQEAGGKEYISKTEDFGPNGPLFETTKRWLEGEGEMYIYKFYPYEIKK